MWGILERKNKMIYNKLSEILKKLRMDYLGEDNIKNLAEILLNTKGLDRKELKEVLEKKERILKVYREHKNKNFSEYSLLIGSILYVASEMKGKRIYSSYIVEIPKDDKFIEWEEKYTILIIADASKKYLGIIKKEVR